MSAVRPKRAMETDSSAASELSDQVDAVFAELEKSSAEMVSNHGISGDQVSGDRVSGDQVSSVTVEQVMVEKVMVEKVLVEKVSVPSVSVESVSVQSVSVAKASVASASVESVFVPSFKVASESASDSAGSSVTISNTPISSLAISSRPARLDPKTRARQLQLRLALTARADGRLATAVGSLFDFARAYPETPEALEALDIITEIALEHEEAGRTRMALDLYERLANFED